MTVTGDIRAISPEQLAAAQATMRRIVSEHLPKTTATISFDEGYPPMAPTDGNRRLLAQYDAASRALGLPPVAAVDPSRAGAADVAFVASAVPMLIDGIGLMGHDDHSAMETADLRTLPTPSAATVVFIVDAVEPCVSFWVDKLGFAAENQVPGDDGKLVFASVKKGSVEVMYQTRASVIAEDPRAASELDGRSAVLFIVVDDVDLAEKAVAGAPVVKAKHKTFYGSTEIYVKEPGGNTIGFAQFG
jgi:uncharacterized glyoxalase superfamily protein PhnB